MKSKVGLVSQAELIDLRQEDLHNLWPFLLRGIKDLQRTMKTNWIPEDIYAALRNGQVTCTLARRGERWLGFWVYSRQLRAFNFRPELFIWAAWNLPIREWEPEDEMPALLRRCCDYVANIAKTSYGTDEISWMTRSSRARAFAKKYGWKSAWVTMTVKIDDWLKGVPA